MAVDATDAEGIVTKREAWEAFHAANPHVGAFLEDAAWEAYQAGVRHFGIAAIFERARWRQEVETKGEPYKLNNNHRAFYARWLMERNPCLVGFFETRAGRQHGARAELRMLR